MAHKSLLIIVTMLYAVRLLITLVHGQAHGQLQVPLAAWQHVYVWLVIMVAPAVAMVWLWIRPAAGVAWALAALVTASWAFGVFFHFGPANPDNVRVVADLPGKQMFVLTAAALAVVEPLVAGAAARLAWAMSRIGDARHV